MSIAKGRVFGHNSSQEDLINTCPKVNRSEDNGRFKI